MRSVNSLICLHMLAAGAHASEDVAANSAGAEQRFHSAHINKLLARALEIAPLDNRVTDDTVRGKSTQPSLAAMRQASPLAALRQAPVLPSAARSRRTPVPLAAGLTQTGSHRFDVRARVLGSTRPEGRPPQEDIRFKDKVAGEGEFLDAGTGKVRKDFATLLYLIKKKLLAVTGPEAAQMVKDEGAVIVDTRNAKDFERNAIKGSLSIPGVIEPDSWNLKKVLILSQGLTYTEPNPAFNATAEELLPRDKPIIVACDRGGRLRGSVKNDTAAEEAGLRAVTYQVTTEGTGVSRERSQESDFDFATQVVIDPYLEIGWESRSLTAAYNLYKLGFTNVYFLLGGIDKYERDGLPMAKSSTSATS